METMQAMVLESPRGPLRLQQRPLPNPPPGEVCLRVLACAVCRTDLHLIDGELPQARYPIVPGHEIVGAVQALGAGVEGLKHGQIVGVPWLGGTCCRCRYCLAGQPVMCELGRVQTGQRSRPSRSKSIGQKCSQLQQYCQRISTGLLPTPSKSSSPRRCPRFSHFTGLWRGAKKPLLCSGQNTLMFVAPFRE